MSSYYYNPLYFEGNEGIGMDEIIEDIIRTRYKDVLESAENKIKKYMDTQYRFKTMDRELLPEKLFGENKKEYIKRIFKDSPLDIVNSYFYDVKQYTYNDTISISPNDLLYSRIDKKIYVREKILLSDIRYLTGIKKCNVYLENIEFISPNIEKEFIVQSVDYFAAEITLAGEILFEEPQNDIFDGYNLCIEIEYYGLKYENNLPIWMDYIIEGSLYQSCGKNKLCIFNYFVAFDCFVQNIYNQIHKCYNAEQYLSDCNNEIELYIEENIDDMLDEALELEHGFISDDEVRDEFTNQLLLKYATELKNYTDELVVGSIELKQETKEEIEKLHNFFARQDKRLINEKLKDIEKILAINLNTPEYGGLSNLKSKLKEVEEKRNNIAHGNNLEIIYSGDEFYVIFTYIVSLIIRYDLHRNAWTEVISYLPYF